MKATSNSPTKVIYRDGKSVVNVPENCIPYIFHPLRVDPKMPKRVLKKIVSNDSNWSIRHPLIHTSHLQSRPKDQESPIPSINATPRDAKAVYLYKTKSGEIPCIYQASQ